MNKSQGLIMGTLLAAVLLFHPQESSSPQQASPAAIGTAGSDTDRAPEAQLGPWIASCNYWAPTREQKKSPASPEIHGTLKDGQINLHLNLDEGRKAAELGCGSDPEKRWGLPEDGDVNITAIIATVPDPVHTHLGLAFDRTIAGILEAAVDNKYVSSSYWVPWRTRAGELKAELSEAEPGHDPERERQPGLIVLRSDSNKNPFANYGNVIYLFLVAETPTGGIDGFQIQNALDYEAYLKGHLEKLGHRFSTGGEFTAVLGPYFSGSMPSLGAAINARRARGDSSVFQVTATISTTPQFDEDDHSTPFVSFGDDRLYSRGTLYDLLKGSGVEYARIAELVEDNTVLGSSFEIAPDHDPKDDFNDVQQIHFPREISLLRNAEPLSEQSGSAGSSGSLPSPFLRFSLRDSTGQDTVPQFSRSHTPLSQEAQLMAIARQLHRLRSQFVSIVATSVLDQIFLAQFLHRACPDVRLVFFESDLLWVREVDNAPFIGSVTVTPYPLIGLARAHRAFSDGVTQSYYNAASYTFWKSGLSPSETPTIQGYKNPWAGGKNPRSRPPLWATAVGSDGYYPLGIISKDSTQEQHTLPPLRTATAESRTTIYPARLWDFLAVMVCLLCCLHIGMLCIADYWSPFTRDLAIGYNDQPRRHSMLIHVATAMLFCMAWVISLPVWTLRRSGLVYMSPFSEALSLGTVALALAAFFTALIKTWGHIKIREKQTGERLWSYDFLRANVPICIDAAAWLTIVGLCSIWYWLCSTSPAGLFLVGESFSYRSIFPGSGVSPVVPVLLLLLSWYLWAVYQTRRLRFSSDVRPWIPARLAAPEDNRYFVSDDDLRDYDNPRNSCLYKNITCLLITREVLSRFRRFQNKSTMPTDIALVALYAALMIWFAVFTPVISGVDHFLSKHAEYRSAPFEFLVGGLFFPLIAVCLAGWLRMIFVWGALRRGLLERLENQPLRYAFSSLQGMGWMTMVRQAGLHEQWRDMARTLESMHQILNLTGLTSRLPGADLSGMIATRDRCLDVIRRLQHARSNNRQPEKLIGPTEPDYVVMRHLEHAFARFGQLLLSSVLIPYWKNARTGFVESSEKRDTPCEPDDPEEIRIAEEFVALRYISLIRAVLANMRSLMMFVSASFVLAILAWNSYPFQPRQQVDWLFTGLLAVLGAGIVWVFAQMHRNPLLSRVTNTEANELGLDFYLRVFSFGALPLLTWLAYQFPEVGSVISKFLQPGISVVK